MKIGNAILNNFDFKNSSFVIISKVKSSFRHRSLPICYKMLNAFTTTPWFVSHEPSSHHFPKKIPQNFRNEGSVYNNSLVKGRIGITSYHPCHRHPLVDVHDQLLLAHLPIQLLLLTTWLQ